ISAPERLIVAGAQNSPGISGTCWTTSDSGADSTSTSYMLGISAWCSMFSAVEVFPCGSASITSTFRPPMDRAAARFTVEEVLPTPPFWLATVMIRVSPERGNSRPSSFFRRAWSRVSSRISGVSSIAPCPEEESSRSATCVSLPGRLRTATHLDHCSGNLDLALPVPGDGGIHPSEPGEDLLRLLDLVGRRGALHGQQRAAVGHERQRPARELVEGGDRTSGDQLEAARAVQPLRPRPQHLETEAQLGVDLLEPGGAAPHRLDQGDLQVRPGDRDHDAGQAGPGADVREGRGGVVQGVDRVD